MRSQTVVRVNIVATVKIAPIERWCKIGLAMFGQNAALQRLPGKDVGIRPLQMTKQALGHEEPCLYWPIETKSLAELLKTIGKDELIPVAATKRVLICEHMLEMD